MEIHLSVEKEIQQKEEELRKAMLNSDLSKLDELISDDLIFTLPTGDVASKEMDIAAHKSGIQKLTELQCLKSEIRVFENVVIVASKMQLKGTYGDHKIDGDYSYTRVWSQEREEWKVIGGQVAPIQS